MKPVFADSYYYVALLNRHDAGHQQAVKLSQVSYMPAVTTDWVLTEVANATSRAEQRGGFQVLYQQLVADPALTIIPASRDLFLAGLDLFFQRDDKNWSLTDCISFVVMKSAGLTDALTSDHHFIQAGFNILMT